MSNTYYPSDSNKYVLIESFSGAAQNLTSHVPSYSASANIWEDSDSLTQHFRIGDVAGALDQGASANQNQIGGLELGVNPANIFVEADIAVGSNIRIYIRKQNDSVDANDATPGASAECIRIRIKCDSPTVGFSSDLAIINVGVATVQTDTDGNGGSFDSQVAVSNSATPTSFLITDDGSNITLTIAGATRTWAGITDHFGQTKIGFGFAVGSASEILQVRAW